MGIEPNSDRMWNAIGGIVIAGSIIAGLGFLVSKAMPQITTEFTAWITKGFSNTGTPWKPA